ncbi:MAG TPA: hypothetical protein VM734_34655 [Kofleriaceae bacterium]|jgi:hypothetical protein|nr:hypothetical protein [Kofleriaceae bacterium]
MVRVVLLVAPLLVVSGGCGALGASTPPDSLQCGSDEAARRTDCPSSPALAAHLRDRWSLAPDARMTTTCVPGAFGAPAWLVHAIVAGTPHERAATFLLQPTCAALTDPALHDLGPGERDVELEVRDLDGDTIDEVLARRTEADARGRSAYLEVLRVAAGRLLPAGKVRLEHDDGDTRCTSTLRYRPRPGGGQLIEVEAAGAAIAGDLCLMPGVHHLELSAGGLRRRMP